MFALHGLTIFGVALALLVVLVLLSGVRYIPNDRVGQFPATTADRNRFGLIPGEHR